MQKLKEDIQSVVDIYKSGNLSKAEILTKKLINDNPKVVFLYNLLGLILAEQKKDEFKLYKNVYNNREQVLLNEKLMQLHNVNISASTKTKIVRQVNGPIKRMIKFKFQKMFMEDKLYSGLPNLNSWLMTTFNRLNRMAEKSNG